MTAGRPRRRGPNEDNDDDCQGDEVGEGEHFHLPFFFPSFFVFACLCVCVHVRMERFEG